MDEYDATIVEACLDISKVSGLGVVKLVLSPHGLCFCDGRGVGRLFSTFANNWPTPMLLLLKLRKALGCADLIQPFTDEELGSIVGRCIRVSVETIEFKNMLRLRVVDFLCYSGVVVTQCCSDNEYVFMMRELIRGGVG